MTIRRAFTLVELVVSLGITGVLSLAIASSIVLSTRALPTPGGLTESQAAAGRALQVFGADVRLATSASLPDARTMNLTIPDITGDAASETVVYAWSGTPGEPLTRTINAESATIISSITDFRLAALNRAAIDAGGRIAEPTDRVLLTIATGSVEVTGEYRLLNARLP